MDEIVGGRYKLIREVLVRGPVRIYHAVDMTNGKPVAVRIITTESDRDLQALLRFQEEGVVLLRLRHPNIWQTYSSFLEGRKCFIVAERVEGLALREILKSGQLDLDRIKTIARQVASALAYGHDHGVFHRDLNPDNIVVTAEGRVKVRAISELGIARLLGRGATINTVSGFDMTSAWYMAPEQIEARGVDGRADIYSLGAVMYEMVTGRPPFEGNDVPAIAFRHIREAPRPPGQLRPELPAPWDALILKAMAKDPAARFQTADAMESAIIALPGSARQDEVAVAFPERLQPKPETGVASRCPKCGREGRGRFCGACGARLATPERSPG